MIVSDNGSEFTSNAILQWTDRGVLPISPDRSARLI